ncbi:unnamed protein product [Ixodes persulcatus]
MGKKCFVPRCTTGYKTCREKFSLFRAPKDEAQLNLWRHAIPRKDRRLEATDHVCERHFEPHLVSKTWTALYNGNVLVSTPRRACLATNAVPMKFPGCPSYLSKTPKTRKRPAERQLSAPVKKKSSSSGTTSERSSEHVYCDEASCATSACDDNSMDVTEGPMSTLDDVKAFLEHVDKVTLCSGGPSTREYPGAVPEIHCIIYYLAGFMCRKLL